MKLDLFVFTSLMVSACSSSEKIPTCIYAELGVDGISNISKELDAKFEDSFEVVLNNNNEKRTITQCAEFNALPHNGFAAENPIDFNPLMRTGARCIALDWLKNVKDAKKSFVDKDDKSPSFLKKLPPHLSAGALSSSDIAALEAAAAQCKTWGEYDKDISIEVRSEHAFTVTTADWIGTITVYGRGDFNNDGFEDVLVGRDGGPSGGSLNMSSVFVFTKTANDSCYKTIQKMN